MNLLKKDFEKLIFSEDVLCVKTIVNINFETLFAENHIYSSISVNLEKKGKYDDNKRIVTLELRHGETRCVFVENGKNAEQVIFNKLKSCFVPLIEVITVYRNYRRLNSKDHFVFLQNK